MAEEQPGRLRSNRRLRLEAPTAETQPSGYGYTPNRALRAISPSVWLVVGT